MNDQYHGRWQGAGYAGDRRAQERRDRQSSAAPVARPLLLDPAEAAPVRALVSMPMAPRGVGMTCRSILTGAAGAGYPLSLFTMRNVPDERTSALPVQTPVPFLLRHMPYPVMSRFVGHALLHKAFLDALADGDIAYLWPSVPVRVYEQVARRGIPIVIEAVNTRMKVARALLDAEYDRLGLPPGHGITDLRIACHEARMSMASAIFTPSPATEAALAGTPLETSHIRTSYGTWVTPSAPLRAPKKKGQPVTFLFVGTASVRKGSHVLLEAWRRVPDWMRLRLVGDIEPGLSRVFADVLGRSNVDHVPFTLNVTPEFDRADVFVLPSIEEGDSIVTYEAADRGLPILASPMGAGRMGAESGAICLIDPYDADGFAEALHLFAASDDLRHEWGALGRRAVLDYDWSLVGPRSFAALHRFFGDRARGG